MSVYGYLRVSTNKKGVVIGGQTTENQEREILGIGWAVTKFFSEQGVSGKIPQWERPAFKSMMSIACAGDSIIVTKLDRLGRTASDILNTISKFKELGIKLIVLQLGGLDITSSTGKLIVGVLAAVAEMELDLTRERIMSGLERTKAAGTKLGPRWTLTPELMRAICAEKEEGVTLDVLAKKHGVYKSLLSRNINTWKGNLEGYEEVWKKGQERVLLKAA